MLLKSVNLYYEKPEYSSEPIFSTTEINFYEEKSVKQSTCNNF